MIQLIEVVQAVEQAELQETRNHYLTTIEPRTPLSLEEARQRVPEDQRKTHPYSAFALWTYYNRTYKTPKGDSCTYCQMFDGQTFTGTQLRSIFPDHVWVGTDIYPNVHKTLWGIDSTCSCLLIREPDEPSGKLNMWGSLGTDWTEQPTKEK